MNQFNLILQDEDCYGFPHDLLEMFRDNLEGCDEEGKEIVNNAITELEELANNEDTFECVYHCYKSPMGMFVFKKLKEER